MMTSRQSPSVQPATQRGFLLIEILVSLVIIAFGLLALAGFVTKATTLAVDTVQRTRASTLLSDMAGRLITNKQLAVAGNYVAATQPATGYGTPSANSTVCPGVGVAAVDLCSWHNLLLGTNDAQAIEHPYHLAGIVGAAVIAQRGMDLRLGPVQSGAAPSGCFGAIQRGQRRAGIAGLQLRARQQDQAGAMRPALRIGFGTGQRARRIAQCQFVFHHMGRRRFGHLAEPFRPQGSGARGPRPAFLALALKPQGERQCVHHFGQGMGRKDRIVAGDCTGHIAFQRLLLGGCQGDVCFAGNIACAQPLLACIIGVVMHRHTNNLAAIVALGA